MIEADWSSESSTQPDPWLPPKSAFTGFRFPPEVIVVGVRWYLRYNLSYRGPRLEEIDAEVDAWIKSEVGQGPRRAARGRGRTADGCLQHRRAHLRRAGATRR